MNRLSLTTLAVVCFSAVTHAAAPAGYDVMTGGDTIGTETSFNSAGKWKSGKAPAAGTKYYSAFTIYTPNITSGSVTFAGDELRFADGGQLWPLVNKGVETTIPNLVLAQNSRIGHGSKRPGLRGSCTLVDTTRSLAAWIETGMELTRDAWTSDHFLNLYGDKNQVMSFRETSANLNHGAGFAIMGDLTGYYGTYLVNSRVALCLKGMVAGTIEVASNGLYRTWYHHGDKNNSAYVDEYDFTQNQTVNTLTVLEGGTVQVAASNVLTVVNLVLKKGAYIDLLPGPRTNGQIVVTGSLTVEGPVYIDHHHGSDIEAGTPPSYESIVLTKGATGSFTTNDFIFVEHEGTKTADLPHAYNTIVTRADGARALVSTRKEIVNLIRVENIETKTPSPLNAAVNASGQPYWSNGAAPTAGKDYLADIDGSINFPQTDDKLPVNFAGDSLTLCKSSISTGNKGVLCAGLSAKSLVLNGGRIQVWSGVTTLPDAYGLTTLLLCGGTMSVFDRGSATSTLLTYGNKMTRVASDLAGTGKLQLTTYSTTSNAKDGLSNFEFTGDNAAWSGKLDVYVASYEKTRGDAEEWGGNIVPNEKVYISLYVRETANLGGAMPTATYDGFALRNYSKLRVKGDAMLNAANRGLYVQGIGQIDVDSNKTFTVANPVRLEGTLRKWGGGTLALSNTLAFTSGAVKPTTGQNLVEFHEGFIRMQAPTALNGAQVKLMTNDVKFVFAVDPADEEMRTKGLYNVLVDTPFEFCGNATKINVELDFGGGEEVAPYGKNTLTLFTVRTQSLAQWLLDKINMRTDYPKCPIVLTLAQDGDGYWQVNAVFASTLGPLIIYH